MSLLSIKFEKIISSSQEQQAILFELLKKRKHNISNQIIPTKKQHNKFVINNPYRAWYLIKQGEVYIGTTYILDNNCLGFYALTQEDIVLPKALKFILQKYKPLKEIKSIRPKNFYINVSPDNNILETQLKILGAEKIQTTFSLDTIYD